MPRRAGEDVHLQQRLAPAPVGLARRRVATQLGQLAEAPEHRGREDAQDAQLGGGEAHLSR
jgi:hypothetical protein